LKNKHFHEEENTNAFMMGGSLFLGQELLNLIESSSNKSSPLINEGKTAKLNEHLPPIQNIIINNYNGNVLKNITNLEPFASQKMSF